MKGTISSEQLQKNLKVLSIRAKSLCGRMADGRPMGLAVSEFLEDLAKGTTDPERIKQRDEFMARVDKDPAAKQQLCAIRIETFNNYLLATANFMNMFFEVVDLKLDERPVAQNTTMQEVNVTMVGADGEPKMVKVTRDDDEALINLGYLTTDPVRYRKTDVYRGSVVDAAMATLKLSYDMQNQMDGRCKTLLETAAFGAFTFTGKRANYTYVANSRINTKNLPTTNDVQVLKADNSSVGAFGFPVLDAIVDYASRWTGAFEDGPLLPTGRILVPPPDIKSISSGITPSGTTRNPIADELLQQGWFSVNYLGKDWTFVPDNTLSPDDGYCYPEFNRKPGRVYLKSALDKEVVSDSYELAKRNEEERFMQKVFGAYINSATRPFIARFKYKA